MNLSPLEFNRFNWKFLRLPHDKFVRKLRAESTIHFLLYCPLFTSHEKVLKKTIALLHHKIKRKGSTTVKPNTSWRVNCLTNLLGTQQKEYNEWDRVPDEATGWQSEFKLDLRTWFHNVLYFSFSDHIKMRSIIHYGTKSLNPSEILTTTQWPHLRPCLVCITLSVVCP